jgi:hypothetical protein
MRLKRIIFFTLLVLSGVGLVADLVWAARSVSGMPGVYNTTPFTLANGEGSAVSTDSHGRVLISTDSALTSLTIYNLTTTNLTATSSLIVGYVAGSYNLGTFYVNSAGAVRASSSIRSDTLCIGADCRTSWPTVSAATQLGQIGDVTTSTPMTWGEMLIYNTTTNEWTSVTTSSLGITGAGTVTSVDMSVPTGLTIGGNPITGAGTLALTYTSGYSIPTDAKQASWDNKWDLASSTIGNAYLTNSSITLSSDGSLTIGTSPVSLGGSSALSLNMANANSWTGLQTFANASTTGIHTVDELCFTTGQCMNNPSPQGSNTILYPWNLVTDIATYEGMRTLPDALAEVDESCAATSGYCAAPIDNYVTTSSLTASGPLVINKIPAGTWSFDTYTYVSASAGVTKLEYNLIRRTSAGTETNLFQATSTEISSLTVILDSINSTQQEFAFDPTDRLVLRIKGWTDSGTAKTIHWLYEGNNHYSHVHTPITIASEAIAFLPANNIFTGTNTFNGPTILAQATTTLLTLGGTTYDTANSAGAWGSLLRSTGNGVGWQTTSSLGLLTTNVAEGTNLYWTNTRFDNRLSVSSSIAGITTLGGLTSAGAPTANWYVDSSGNVSASGTLTALNAQFSPAGYLIIPNSADPTVNATGKVALNTTSASSSLRFHDGVAERALYPDTQSSILITSSTLTQFGGLSGTSSIPIGFASNHGETFIEATCSANVAIGIDFGDGTNKSDYIACGSATTTKTFTVNNTFTMREAKFINAFPTASFQQATLTWVLRKNAD